MNDQKILVPIDFSEVSQAAIATAIYLAEKSNLGVTLFHISNNKSEPDASDKLLEMTKSLSNPRVKVDFVIRKGNVLTEISGASCDQCYAMMVIGTHGFKGLREKVFGADILKLLKSIPIPVVSVQKDYQIPKHGFKKILFPASSHEAFLMKVQATIRLAKLFDSEVYIYTVEKPGIELTGSLRGNIRMAKAEFATANVKFDWINEEQQSFSVGNSKQIMTYAKSNAIDIIALMTNPTYENYYFADSDKVTILTNEANIPVLCTSDKFTD